jgi:hypothetical protein
VLLAILVATYCGASLLHFAHNGIYIADYPNMPPSITAPGVYGVWLGQTAIGASGCLLLWRGWRIAGLLVIAFYAALGFDGLLHYLLAPVSAHTAMMNFTIWFEIAAAALLAGSALWQAVRRTP